MPPKANTRKRKPENDAPGQSDTDKTAKRPRARAKAKATAMDQSDIQEVARNKEAQVMRIEADLDKHHLGSFRMSASALDFEWRGSDTTHQRRVSPDHVKKMLMHYKISGLWRCAKEHHIAATVNKDVFFEAVQATKKTRGYDPLDPKYRSQGFIEFEPEDIANDGTPVAKLRTDAEGLTPIDRGHNANTRFPFLVMPAGVTVEAQSGQHRIHALRQLFSEERDTWWVINLYDDRLGNAAKEKLRLNVTQLHKPPTLAEVWQNLLVYRDQGDKNATDVTLSAIKSGAKVRQLLNFSQYRGQITLALRSRGVWPMFTGGRLSSFLPMRSVEENVRYLTRVNQIWEFIGEGIPDFYEAIDEPSLRMIEGLAPARFAEDANKVDQGMEEGRLFFKITDKEHRSIIHKRLKLIDYRILTLNTFWEDTKSLSYMSRVMSDACFWISEEFAAASKRGTASKHSLAVTYKAGFKPRLVYPRQRNYPQYIIKDNKLEPMGSTRLPDGPYCAFAYFQIWLFVIRNFFALHKALNPIPNTSQVEPLPWVGQGVVISDDMTDEQIEHYNKRFSIPEWRMLWEFSRALGFFPEYAESIEIGPEHCELPQIPVQDPEAMAHLLDMRRLSDAVRSLRPSLAEEDIDTLSSSFAEQLPSISEDELEAFGEVCPRTENEVQRVGGIEEVWLPNFHACHNQIDWASIAEMGRDETTGRQVSIAEDAERTSLSWFVKRDFIWVFMRPFADGGPIFGPRLGPWPPALTESKPQAGGQDILTEAYDDDLLGAFRNIRRLAVDEPGSDHREGSEEDESENALGDEDNDEGDYLPDILGEDGRRVSGEETDVEPAPAPASEGYYAEDEGVDARVSVRLNPPENVVDAARPQPPKAMMDHSGLPSVEPSQLVVNRDLPATPLPASTLAEHPGSELSQARLTRASHPEKSLEDEDEPDPSVTGKRSDPKNLRASTSTELQNPGPPVEEVTRPNLSVQSAPVEVDEFEAPKRSEEQESPPPSKRSMKGSKARGGSKAKGQKATIEAPNGILTNPKQPSGAADKTTKALYISPATEKNSTRRKATKSTSQGVVNPMSTLYKNPPRRRPVRGGRKGKGKAVPEGDDDESDSVFAV